MGSATETCLCALNCLPVLLEIRTSSVTEMRKLVHCPSPYSLLRGGVVLVCVVFSLMLCFFNLHEKGISQCLLLKLEGKMEFGAQIDCIDVSIYIL